MTAPVGPAAASTGTAPAGPPPLASPTPPLAAVLPRPALVAGRVLATLWADRKARIGLIVLAALIGVALLAPVISPFPPGDANFARSLSPSGAHLLGTTGSGQDALSQLLWGARVSLLVGFVAGAAASVIAIVVGLVAGYLPGAADEVLMFVTNLTLAIPALPLMIVLAVYLSGGGVKVIVLVIIVTSWATGARVIRSQTATLRTRDFIALAQFGGERLHRIVFREVLPNMTSLVTANFFAAATAAVLGEAGLEFLGLGNPTTVSWGTMLYWAQNSGALLTGQWVLILAPGLAIALLAAAFSLINFGVDALSNPRLREKS
ncbi:MAG TPA: ABC transporter permease [Streptosporangiaceae bacterium]|jgi:peptide/nickel transport system permease protein|nr:ABC transporter permease [Streptosporangiaceae bacterium]